MIFYLGNPQEIFWESPARWSWEDVIQQPADKDNFLQLLKEFKMAFEPGRLIFRQEASAARKHKKASGFAIVKFLLLWDLFLPAVSKKHANLFLFSGSHQNEKPTK